MPTHTRVLIIDDDERLNALLTEYLGRFGFAVRAATHPTPGLRALKADPPDLVILDVMLPDMDGLAVCRKIRETSRVPIIMLTARGDVPDRIVGLELGADDYLAKPFEPRELVARMQAVLRRGGNGVDHATDVLRAGQLELDFATRSAQLNGRSLSLTTAEFELLGFLVRNRGRVLSRERIIEGTHGINWEAFDRSIDVLISRLRQKLGDDAKQPAFIRTVRGVGYSFVGGENTRG
ncbi:MAG TPA: response regulator transcription factor [Gemmatimonadaceae bacterium]|nr:response regulator transcription factor [Gemmatimonadaceae bacterium]